MYSAAAASCLQLQKYDRCNYFLIISPAHSFQCSFPDSFLKYHSIEFKFHLICEYWEWPKQTPNSCIAIAMRNKEHVDHLFCIQWLISALFMFESGLWNLCVFKLIWCQQEKNMRICERALSVYFKKIDRKHLLLRIYRFCVCKRGCFYCCCCCWLLDVVFCLCVQVSLKFNWLNCENALRLKFVVVVVVFSQKFGNENIDFRLVDHLIFTVGIDAGMCHWVHINFINYERSCFINKWFFTKSIKCQILALSFSFSRSQLKLSFISWRLCSQTKT